MSTILGLISTEEFKDERYKNVRSSVFYDYPNGAAPLTGILSLLEEEVTDDPEFFWHEDRLPAQRTTLKNISTTVVFSDPTTPYGAKSGNFTWTKDTSYGIEVVDRTHFRLGQVVELVAINASGDEQRLRGRVTALPDSPANRIILRAIETAAVATDHDAANAGKVVVVIGSAYAQGSRSEGDGNYRIPIRPGNFCQIFKTAYELTGTAAKVPVKYDEDGISRGLSQQNALTHMIEMEKAWLWGRKGMSTTTTNGKPEYYTGGIEWMLEQFEAQYSIYRGGNGSSTGPAAVTADSDDDKRIIENTDGKMTPKRFMTYLERVFRVTSNRANEKLILCGNGALTVMQELYEGKVNFNVNVPYEAAYGMDVVQHRTTFGTVWYKTHPLFNLYPEWRNMMLVLDVNNLRYRYMTDRDTHLKQNIEENDADYARDQWLTESGLELRFPESHMLIKNVTTAALS